MNNNKKIATWVGTIIIIIIAITAFYFVKKTNDIKNVSNDAPAVIQTPNLPDKPVEDVASTEPPVITETTTDAITGIVTAVSAESITVKDASGEKKFALSGKVDTFSIDKIKGIVTRDFSEVKKGMKVTVNFNVKANSGAYIVLEK